MYAPSRQTLIWEPLNGDTVTVWSGQARALYSGHALRPDCITWRRDLHFRQRILPDSITKVNLPTTRPPLMIRIETVQSWTLILLVWRNAIRTTTLCRILLLLRRPLAYQPVPRDPVFTHLLHRIWDAAPL
jgi:hypothetical protein